MKTFNKIKKQKKFQKYKNYYFSTIEVKKMKNIIIKKIFFLSEKKNT